MKRMIAGALASLVMLALGPAVATANTEAAREQDARQERVRDAMEAADARTRSQEAREMITERGYETRKAVVLRNQGDQGQERVNPDAGYDQRAQRGIHQESSEY